MKNLLLGLSCFVLQALLLGGCASSHQPATTQPLSTTTKSIPAEVAVHGQVAADTGHVQRPRPTAATFATDSAQGRPTGRPSLFRRLFSSQPASTQTQATTAYRKCKGCTITVNQVAGDQRNEQTTVAKKAQVATDSGTLNNVGKSKGPAVAGQGEAKDQSRAGVASDVHGTGNAPVLTNTVPPAAHWYDALLGPTGKVLALVVSAGILYGLWWLVGLWRRKRQVEQAVAVVTGSNTPGSDEPAASTPSTSTPQA